MITPHTQSIPQVSPLFTLFHSFRAHCFQRRAAHENRISHSYLAYFFPSKNSDNLIFITFIKTLVFKAMTFWKIIHAILIKPTKLLANHLDIKQSVMLLFSRLTLNVSPRLIKVAHAHAYCTHSACTNFGFHSYYNLFPDIFDLSEIKGNPCWRVVQEGRTLESCL